MASHDAVIDLHGLRHALSVNNAAVISGIQNGSIAVFRNARHDLEKAYPDLYAFFQGIPGRKVYVDVTVQHKARAAVLLEQYGASVFTRKPSISAFQELAAALDDGLTLISADKGLTDLQQIAAKCGVGHNLLVSVVNL